MLPGSRSTKTLGNLCRQQGSDLEHWVVRRISKNSLTFFEAAEQSECLLEPMKFNSEIALE
jgi:hypothetical protein